MALDGPSDQSILTSAFKDALTTSTDADGKTLFGRLKEVQAAIASIPAGGGGTIVTGVTGSGGGAGNNQGGGTDPFSDDTTTGTPKAKGFLEGFTAATKEGIQEVDKFIEKMKEYDTAFTEITNYATNMYDPIQETLGGIDQMTGEATNATSKAVKSNMQMVEQIYLASADTLSGFSDELVVAVGDTNINPLAHVFRNV